MNYDELKPLLSKDNDTTYVFNFWATWCSPCVKELPYFIQLDSLYGAEAFRLVLVSLDFKKDYLRKLQPFVKEKGLEEHVLVLEDSRSNYWINDIDKIWGGSIPATLVVKGNQRAFYERTFHDVKELSDIVKPLLNQ
ncbi:MAG TPA: TlpA disulfide reductase family protein [Saprospiraceae bacterium]|nr:TlpA disulfide reductase family protein [Saprospiraceae bacterium]